MSAEVSHLQSTELHQVGMKTKQDTPTKPGWKNSTSPQIYIWFQPPFIFTKGYLWGTSLLHRWNLKFYLEISFPTTLCWICLAKKKKKNLTVHLNQIFSNDKLGSTSPLTVSPQISSTQPVLSQGMFAALSLLFLNASCPLQRFFNSSTAIPTRLPEWATAWPIPLWGEEEVISLFPTTL